MNSLVVVGGDSAIGAVVLGAEKLAGWSLQASTRRTGSLRPGRFLLDLANPDTFENLPKATHLLFCAGIVDRRECAEHPAQTSKINIEAAKAVIDWYMAQKSHITYLSTNLVLDGKTEAALATAQTCPIDEYGRQKLEIEKFLSAYENHAICRLGKVLHPDVQLIQNWINNIRSGVAIEAFSDYYMSPVTMEFVSDVIVGLMQNQTTGIIQATASDTISYAEFAQELCIALNEDPKLVIEVTAAQRGIDVTREPRYAHLNGSRLREIGMKSPKSSYTAAAVAASSAL